MDKPEASQDARPLDEQVRELERREQQAGISQTMQVARAGHALAPSALGGHAIPQDYVAEDYDHRRRAIRDAYFSVDDIQLRKQLIMLSRGIDDRHRLSANEQVEKAQREISIASLKIARRPWGQTALLGAALAAFGYWVAQEAGGIAGAVAGFLLGAGVHINARNDARRRLAQAQHMLEQAKSDQAAYMLFPEVFGPSEEASGQRNTDLDLESAYRNSLRQRKTAYR